MYTSLSWVRKGLLQPFPKKHTSSTPINNNEEENTSSTFEDSLKQPYDMQFYDQEDTSFERLMISDNDVDNDVESEDEEALNILSTDCPLAITNNDMDVSSLELYIYDEINESFYIHHDVVIPECPLCCEYIQSNDKNNLLAIGDIGPYISIWDLDTVDELEAFCVLPSSPLKLEKRSKIVKEYDEEGNKLIEKTKKKKEKCGAQLRKQEVNKALKKIKLINQNLLQNDSFQANSIQNDSISNKIQATQNNHNDNTENFLKKNNKINHTNISKNEINISKNEINISKNEINISKNEINISKNDTNISKNETKLSKKDKKIRKNALKNDTKNNLSSTNEQTEEHNNSSNFNLKNQKKTSKKNKNQNSSNLNSHTAAVLTLHLSPIYSHILASGSEDTTTKLWDIPSLKCIQTFQSHQNKVQTVKFHPYEPFVLLSASFDQTLHLYDIRHPHSMKLGKLPSTAECAIWNQNSPTSCLVSCESGQICCYDIRKMSGENKKARMWKIHAHDESVSSINDCKISNLLVSCSTDGYAKIWNLNGEKPSLVHQKNLNVGSLLCCKNNLDIPTMFAFGGEDIALWDISESAIIRNTFSINN